METSDGRDGGEILLVNAGTDALRVRVDMQNLDPGPHAIHFHQNPSCDAPSFQTAGAHFNGWNAHEGGNISVELHVKDNGDVHQSFVVPRFTLDPSSDHSVLGHGGTSIIVSSGPNDPSTRAPGASSKPEACGVVTLKNASQQIPRLQHTPPLAAPSNH